MIYHGDLFDVLPTLEAESIDACVTDPPYELGFMAKAWDVSGVAFRPETWAAVLRVLKPGAHLLAFGGTRTFHRMTVAIEDAGFEIRDCLSWLYGSGFPKSLNLGDGLGTALKPGWEPIVLARKPMSFKTVANVAQYGTGALNIDDCRVVDDEPIGAHDERDGRWPANVLLDRDAATMLDEITGEMRARGNRSPTKAGSGMFFKENNFTDTRIDPGDIGGASRFFYVAKPSREERDYGCHAEARRSAGECTGRVDGSAGLASPRAGAGRTGGARNIHPTVKPVELMRYLVRLITPLNGVVIDPFMGSGTTGMACRYEMRQFIGIEQEAEYVAIAERRIASVAPLFGEHTA